MKSVTIRLSPFLAICAALALIAIATAATIGISWRKAEVIPVVLVKPGIVGFEPVEGSSIGITWQKSEVKPVLLVKPGIVGFEPREGSTIGISWRREEVLPVMLVEPDIGGFGPLRLITGSADTAPARRPYSDVHSAAVLTKETASESRLIEAERQLAVAVAKIAPAGDGAGAVETTMDGEFQGWDGETIFKLANGQIWQQVTYAYTYHYAYRPKVLILKVNNSYKMKVEGVDQMIFVKRLR